MIAPAKSSSDLGNCAASASINLRFLGFSAISFGVAE